MKAREELMVKLGDLTTEFYHIHDVAVFFSISTFENVEGRNVVKNINISYPGKDKSIVILFTGRLETVLSNDRPEDMDAVEWESLYKSMFDMVENYDVNADKHKVAELVK
jgi:hypothetical protein